jgi:predicted ester cyclase
VELNDSSKTMIVTPADLKKRHRAQLEAMPDCKLELEDIVAEGKLVAYRWSLRGTQTGELRGIPPTGKFAVMPGMTIVRVKGGQIVAGWHNDDLLGLLAQLGVVPAPGQ